MPTFFSFDGTEIWVRSPGDHFTAHPDPAFLRDILAFLVETQAVQAL